MKTIEDYIANLDETRAKRVLTAVEYVRKKYPNAEETLDYAPKTKIPTFKIGKIYVSIASMKSHVSIHFGKYEATKIVAEADPRIKERVGCVNIPDSVPFPSEAVRRAIDYCFLSEM